MSEGPMSAAVSGFVVLGISVVDDQITSVVRDADGHVLASNLVDLPDSSAAGAEAAIIELVNSVPVEVDRIGISASREDLRKHLVQAFGPRTAAGEPWYDKVLVTGYASALAEIACVHSTRGGVVAVVDLDRNAAPAAGTTLATIDTATGSVLGTADFTSGQLAPVTDPEGASQLATAVTKLPRGRDVTSVIVVGPGAQLPGIAPAFEYAAQRPVTVADNPSLASAVGAADAAVVALAAPAAGARGASTGKRWWFVGAAIGAAVFLGAIGITLILAAEPDVPEAAPVTVTETPAAVTRTEEATVTETETRTDIRTTTVTSTPRPVTRTTTVTEPPPVTLTVTETETVFSPAPGNDPSAGAPGAP
ncbi:hypothetical protein IA539_21105 [Gordonia sp. zg691]|uniref:Uncharacterized protein n=1 Tax=Gordonia jinghuaiqii TaxID=2758710 RepID=A0A7D7QZI4_9ACTN|nr:hypothetical protein [Gordonia jinghuaiqii]MBD0863677.1 hypothetical protein [Gordonia jinghuaiqii]MCR5979410.1 hypothetical protein [Gordonia jinghuaiqii]QMT01191.1 hypothetical protein H1R19_20430 [Gordonia jinghuaiqii]